MTKEKLLFVMNMSAMLTVEELTKETNESQEQILLDFMKSNTTKILYNDATKLWWDGSSAIAEECKKEINF